MGKQLPSPKNGAEPPQFSAHVYCGQTARGIKMPLGVEVDLGPGHIMLDGDPARPPPKGHSPPTFAHICCGQMAGWIKMSPSLDPSNIVLDGDPAPLPKKGGRAPNFQPMYLWPNGWMDRDVTWYGGRPWPRQRCVRREPRSTPLTAAKGAQRPPSPLFGPCLSWPLSPISATAELLC